MDAKQLIQEIIEKQGVTPYRIAKDLDVEPSTVYKWQSGKKAPNGAHMIELLRKAGRLAAMVVLGAITAAGVAPQDASANTPNLLNLKPENAVYYVKFLSLRIRLIFTKAINLLRWPALSRAVF